VTRLATVGCGEHATGSHGPALALYAARERGTELVACCDLDPGKAERYRARFGFARAYTDLRKMLDTERPDAVSLVAPLERTCELSCLILEWGFPLLLEKPPGRHVAETDRMIAAAGGIPHQVAFNRRFAPLFTELRRELDERLEPAERQHVRYEMTRVDRRDADFSTTAVHGIDAVRVLAGCDYAEVRFRYQDLSAAGPGVANVFLDAVMASGATAHLAFCPMAGVLVERAVVHGRDHTFTVHLPVWNGFDAPGRLQHLEKGQLMREVTGDEVLGDVGGTRSPAVVHGGFYGEYASFLGALREGRPPSPNLKEARQSVAVAQCIRERRPEYRA
jgi:myo-inositol 2-dehydrogenase/D-chiro-inositol 1-dehydrogenase